MGIASLGGLLSGAGDVQSPNVGQTTNDFGAMMSAYLGQAGNIYNNERQFKPGYAALDAGLYKDYFRQGFNTMMPNVTADLRRSTPEGAGLLDTLGQQAQDQLKLNGALDPAAQRQVQQSVRSSQASRGLGYGPGDAAQEQFYQMQTQEQRRAQNQQLASQVAQQDFSTYGLPALGIAAAAGSGEANAAVGANPTLAPQNMSSMLLTPYQASLQQNLATSQNNTGLYESMDKNQTSLVSSAMSSL